MTEADALRWFYERGCLPSEWKQWKKSNRLLRIDNKSMDLSIINSSIIKKTLLRALNSNNDKSEDAAPELNKPHLLGQ